MTSRIWFMAQSNVYTNTKYSLSRVLNMTFYVLIPCFLTRLLNWWLNNANFQNTLITKTQVEHENKHYEQEIIIEKQNTVQWRIFKLFEERRTENISFAPADQYKWRLSCLTKGSVSHPGVWTHERIKQFKWMMAQNKEFVLVINKGWWD